jgi:hypothetical protein
MTDKLDELRSHMHPLIDLAESLPAADRLARAKLLEAMAGAYVEAVRRDMIEHGEAVPQVPEAWRRVYSGAAVRAVKAKRR